MTPRWRDIGNVEIDAFKLVKVSDPYVERVYQFKGYGERFRIYREGRYWYVATKQERDSDLEYEADGERGRQYTTLSDAAQTVYGHLRMVVGW